MEHFKSVVALAIVLGSWQVKAGEPVGWSAVVVSWTAVVGSILGAGVVCLFPQNGANQNPAEVDNNAGRGFQFAACFGAIVFAAGQTVDAGCQSCRFKGGECGGC